MARVSAVFFGEHSSGFRSDVKVQSRFKGNPTPLREGLNGGEGGGVGLHLSVVGYYTVR